MLAFACAHAAEPELPPVASFVIEPEFYSPQLSPDGRTLALIGTKDSTRYLAFIDLQTMQASVNTSLSDRAIDQLWWKGNDLLFIYNAGWFSFGSFVTLNLSSKKVSVPHTFNRITDSVVHGLPADPDQIIVSTALNTGIDLRLFNTRTFSFKVIEDNPGHVVRWYVNSKLEAVAALGLKDDDWFLLSRSKPGAPWQRTALGDRLRPDFSPAGMHEDQRRVIGWDNRTADTVRIVARDLATGVDEVLFHRPDLDPSLIHFWGTEPGRARAVSWSEDRERLHYFSAADQALAASIDAAIPGATNYIVSSSADETRLVIESQAESRPDRYFLLDRRAGRLIPLGSRSDALLHYRFGAGRHFTFQARDGLSASARLLLPPGVMEPKGLPVVVFSPADLEARTTATFNPFTQLLASRGYAVLQVNHRGVSGFGQKFSELGNETIHSSMADDLVDALDHAASAGWVDGSRVCVIGAGGGGLLPLYAISRNPGKFKAWINFYTPMSRAPLSNSQLSFGLTPTWGRPTSVSDRRRLRKYALQLDPLPVALNVTIPSLHIYDAASLGQGEEGKLQKALEKAGAPARFLKPRGSNDWSDIVNERNRQARQDTVRTWTSVLDFLQEQLGTAATPRGGT